MKVTNSKDGIRRTDLRINVRVGAEELAQGLALRTTREMDWREDMPTAPSRDYILDTYREMVRGYGTETLDYWREKGFDDEDVDEVWEWARTSVQTAFPEFEMRGI